MKNPFASLLLVVLLTSSCHPSGRADSQQKPKIPQERHDQVKETVVKVYSFHTDKRCVTCRAIESLTREVIHEMNNQKLDLQVVNISHDAHTALAEKYEIVWSSLVLDNGRQVSNLTELAFSLAKSKPQIFKEKLKLEINKLL